jgi:hypothetical protein
MLAGTDGLLPWLDIDRFHVSRHSLAPYPTATVQGAAGLQHLIDDFHHLIKETLNSERLALPTMLPWWRPTFTLRESDRMCEENLPGIRGIRRNSIALTLTSPVLTTHMGDLGVSPEGEPYSRSLSSQC